MAGDWIPVRTDLPDNPKTLRIAQRLRKSTDEVVGLLVRFWAWVQQHTETGRLEGISIELCALGARVPSSFLEALVDVGWLVTSGPDLLIPEFPRWFSGAAKRRLRDAARKRAVRSVSAKCPQNVRTNADKKRTTGEESIEEESASADSTPPTPPQKRGGEPIDWDAIQFQPGCDTAEVRAAISEWLEYRRQIGKRYKQPERQISLLLAEHGRNLPEAVRHSIAQGYQGCYAQKGGSVGARCKVGRGERHPADAKDRWAN